MSSDFHLKQDVFLTQMWPKLPPRPSAVPSIFVLRLSWKPNGLSSPQTEEELELVNEVNRPLCVS